MSNEIFESLYKKYESMIYLFIKKYKGMIEEDEIRQACLIAIVKAHKTYNSHKDMKFSNWVYQNMQWEIYKEIRNTKHLTKDCVSLQTVLNSSEDDNMTLEDTLQDENVNIQEEIESKIMMDYYESECRRVLPNDKFQVCYLRWFENYSYKAIEKVTKKNNISGILLQSQSLLLAKSRIFNEEYRKLVGISEYNTERLALI